jgi:hypothetical protein
LASEAGTDEAPRRRGPAFARFEPNAALLFDAESGRRIEPEHTVVERKGVAR